MTPFEGALLLLGLFGVPIGLLAVSHRFRDRGRRARGAFWGGLGGYLLGLVIWLGSLLGRAVMWDSGSARLAGVILPLVGLGLVGGVIGAMIGRTPRRGPKAPGRRGRKKKSEPSSGASSTTPAMWILFALATASGPLTAQGSAARAGTPADLFVVRDVDANVILAETAPGIASSAYASSVAVIGSAGVLLVDTFHGPGPAEWFLDRIAERTDAPVRWVVNTHAHGDHVWGNAAVLERFPEAEILAHPATIESLEADGVTALDAERMRLDRRVASLREQIAALPEGDGQVERGRTLLARAEAQRAETDRVILAPPTVPVPDFRRIDVGTRTVWIQPVGPAHTDGDLVVWIDGILAAGDIVEEGTLWIEGADVRAWASTLAALARRGPAIVIPAHGGLPESTDRAALLHLQRDALQAAVVRAGRTPTGSEVDASEIRESFAELRAAFAEWGVGRDAFDDWMIRAIEAARN